jgi:hypothetical protein
MELASVMAVLPQTTKILTMRSRDNLPKWAQSENGGCGRIPAKFVIHFKPVKQLSERVNVQ